MHILKNDGDEPISEVLLQDYLPNYIRPLMHSLKVYKKREDSTEIIDIDPNNSGPNLSVKSTYAFDSASNSLVTLDFSG